MDGYSYTQGVGGGLGGGLQSGFGAQAPAPYAPPAYGTQGPGQTQVQQGTPMGPQPTPQSDPYAGYLGSANSWFGRVNPNYVSNNSLNANYTQDSYLNGLQPYQINALNGSMGGHSLGDSWNFGAGTNNMHYGYQPGNNSYLGNYLQIGTHYYNPDQYQQGVDDYNKAASSYGNYGSNPLPQASTIYDVVNSAQNPYLTGMINKGPSPTNNTLSSYANSPYRTTNSGGLRA